MDFVEILKRVDRDLYDSSDKAALPKLARFLERSNGIGGLLKSNNPILDSFATSSLLKLQDAYVQFEKWKEAYRNTKRSMAASKLALPDRSFTRTAFPHELSALERVARMCQRTGYPDVSSWEKAVDAHLALWNACVKLAMEKGQVSSVMAAADHADAAQFEPYLFGSENIRELKKYLWLGARRGERAGIIQIKMEMPGGVFLEQARAHIADMGIAAQRRELESVVDELVGSSIEKVVCSLLDNEAEREALQTARDAYVGLLQVSEIESEKIVSIYIGSSDSSRAAVVLDKTGKLLDKHEAKAGESLIAKVESILADTAVSTVILPVSASDDQALREMSDLVDGRDDLAVIRILPAAISIARQKMSAPPAIASALILAFRAIRPHVEWANVPAASIGLGEFSADLDDTRLEAALSDSRLLLAYETKRGAAGGTTGKRVQKKRRLNPLVRTIRDLKPGMSLDGIVTNLTKFGAFVNVGLATEAMIHVSQLSTDFIEEPSQVVKVGQTVNARVLEVIPEKGRIALSLKPAGADMPRRQQESRELQQARENASAIFNDSELAQLRDVSLNGPPRPHGGGNMMKPPSHGGGTSSKDQPKKSRSEALADLNALFKK
ncbi:MAG: S1 RNA-binding domain-containing protein [Deltaproteobacteria bacterium]|nr:S1 RNA-binding domain-containing protein [Deltaproteobacteria bacterium]